MFFKDCNNCATVKSQSETIKILYEKIMRIKRHYREDVEALNHQIVLERNEFERIELEIKESPPLRDMRDAHEYHIQTQWRANQRNVYYPHYFKDLVVEVNKDNQTT